MENKEVAVSKDNKINLALFAQAGVSEEDKAKVREYAKLEKTKNDIIIQIKKLDEVAKLIDAKWCKKYLWTNQRGEVIPIFDIEDDYLKNIYNWHKKNEREVPKEIKKEYYSRFGYDNALDEESKFASAKTRKRSIPFDEDDYDYDNHWN